MASEIEPARYHPSAYWEQLLASDFTLGGVSHPYLPAFFNRLLYRALERSMRAAVGRRELAGCEVLDVGSGTGFWLEFWRDLGVRRLVGIDLTETSVRRLSERFSDVELHRLDIGEDDVAALGTFDLVSVVNVLLHVTDERRFEGALENLGRLLRPGGLLLVIDPVVVHRGWGPAGDERSNSAPRTVGAWKAAAQRVGLELSWVRPVTVLLDAPVDTRTRSGYRLLSAYWRLLCRGVNQPAPVGPALARVVSTVDTLLAHVVPTGPSLKCAVFRRR
jgi:SAM-dependent methyltransferase